MQILLIIAHPEGGSFNHAIANTCREQLENNGHKVIFHDLYQENFNPVFNPKAKPGSSETEDLIKQHQADLGVCEGIVVIHPNWWGQPPAILKGWIEQVLSIGLAYRFKKNEDGTMEPQGLLTHKRAVVINTSNTSEELEEKLYNDPLETIWKNRVFGFCGITQFNRLNFNVIKESDEDQRLQWLSQAKTLMNSFFNVS